MFAVLAFALMLRVPQQDSARFVPSIACVLIGNYAVFGDSHQECLRFWPLRLCFECLSMTGRALFLPLPVSSQAIMLFVGAQTAGVKFLCIV